MKKKEPKPYARPEKLHSISFKCNFAIKQLIQQSAMLQKKTISKYLENIFTHYPILRAEYNKLKNEFKNYKQDSEDYVEGNYKKQWVDVRDRLPRHKNEVLVVDMEYSDGYYGIGSCIGNEGWAIKGSNHWNPTHWKELDKPL